MLRASSCAAIAIPALVEIGRLRVGSVADDSYLPATHS